MAEAMLADEYRSSHDNLKQWEIENNEKADSGTVDHKRKSEDHRREEQPQQEQQDECDESRVEQKSVVINVPPKRRKISNACLFNTSDVVQALNKCMSEEERFDAIQMAISAFDHTDQFTHDAEIEAGADIALVKMLVFLEFKTGFRRKPIKANLEAITREISLTLQALEMVYRASPEAILTSFKRVGTDLLHNLVILVDEEVMTRVRAYSPHVSPETASMSSVEKSTTQADRTEQDSEANRNNRSVTPPPYGNAYGVGNWDRDLMLRKTSKILGHFARVGEATKAIAHFPGLLGSILNLVNMRPYDAVPWEARLSCLWTIANLACCADNMVLMMCTPGLINALVNVGFRQTEPSDPLERTMEILRARSIASRAIYNLSWPVENKIPMASNIALVRVLCQLAIQRKAPYAKSNTVHDIMVQTRRHAIGAIRNIAAAPRRSKIGLCEYNNGKLLDVLTDVALNDSNEKAVELAFAAMHSLAIHDTAAGIVERPALVLALKNQLLAEEDEKRAGTRADDGVRSHVSATLLVLERSITVDMPQYENLRELLHAIHPSPPSDSESTCSEAINTAEV
eukprot:CAMPEP_0117045014 /NCGR_PEP_ID=MMETSP0472-20121206/31164_1 /TAXON_ID=693140 ORGANISM="Tiarina fusus, Strain LIS" /NCGR_SAMPLE_ID=MMETSP0472 /ASSEMBLY_ACC=CAM_ASM_000603 /LENGTH=571 /DNA_ID=CAMNT_0004756899 /DNA_START=149 /DNA_END=1864 /DNA_ORIENTATION=-